LGFRTDGSSNTRDQDAPPSDENQIVAESSAPSGGTVLPVATTADPRPTTLVIAFAPGGVASGDHSTSSGRPVVSIRSLPGFPDPLTTTAATVIPTISAPTIEVSCVLRRRRLRWRARFSIAATSGSPTGHSPAARTL